MKQPDMIALAHSLLQTTATPPAEPQLAADDIKRKADRLGLLHAVIAQSKTEADTLRAELEKSGLKEIEGALYRVAFADCKGATRTDWKAVAAKLKPSRQLVAAHTSTGDPSIRMTVTARPTH
jgi:predicted TIM-barrel fold metal-dependent hydrolase